MYFYLIYVLKYFHISNEFILFNICKQKSEIEIDLVKKVHLGRIQAEAQIVVCATHV
jgi:hypothetical protein